MVSAAEWMAVLYGTGSLAECADRLEMLLRRCVSSEVPATPEEAFAVMAAERYLRLFADRLAGFHARIAELGDRMVDEAVESAV